MAPKINGEMSNNDDGMRLPEEGTPTGAGPGTGDNASDQWPRNSRQLGRGNPEIQSTAQRSRITTGSPPAESAALNIEEFTQAGLPRRRIKWTYDMNVSVLRAYFRATRAEAETLHYRQQMRNLFLLDYPNLTHLSEQNLADRKRAIERRNLIPPTIVEQLRREASNEFREHPTSEGHTLPTPRETPTITAQDQEIDNNSIVAPTVSAPQINIPDQDVGNLNISTDDLTTSIINIFNTAKIQFMGMNVELRPYLPKPKLNKTVFRMINILNSTVLPAEVAQGTSYHHIVDLIYCSAYTIVKSQNSHENSIYQGNNPVTRATTQRSRRKPQWQIRLENKIESIRKDLGYLLSYKDNRVSKRKRNRYEVIRRRHITHTRHEPQNETLAELIDTVKQKLNTTVDRYRRYMKSYSRKTHNTLFANSEKRFYSMLRKGDDYENNIVDTNRIPMADMELFWSKTWSMSAEHNKQATWLTTVLESATNINDMSQGVIDNDTFHRTISRLHNWKQPGPDKVHNFYYKYLRTLHQPLLDVFNNFLVNPDQIPITMCIGMTYLKPKSNEPTSPSEYRPITCLNTGYKLFTACLTRMINLHCESNNILSIQQKGCRAGTKGCKDQLVIDSILTNQAIRDKRNMYAAFIDYQKAFDSVPHSWLIEVLRIYKIHENIIKCLEVMKDSWRTQLSLNTPEGNLTSTTIPIKRGIYQGDSLSPLLFCLALNPLSHLLEKCQCGYLLRTEEDNIRISHSLYMDDLKLYAGTKTGLQNLLRVVEVFTQDIGMKFGIDKCRTQNIHRGKLTYANQYTTSDSDLITPLGSEEYYKYLGILQNLRIEHAVQKRKLTAEFTQRMDRICRTKLNGRNIARAINTYAIPVLTYSFGIVSWSRTDLSALDRKVRTLLTKYSYHHPKSSLERINLPRKRGGRGILSITILHDKQINSLRKYFITMAQTDTLYNILREADDNLTPLDLKNGSLLQIATIGDLETAWKSKAIHGRYPNEISQDFIDINGTHKWLTCGTLFPETEGHIIAIQDGIICTRNYLKYIIKDQGVTTDLCRMCGSGQETISHIINGCTVMSATHYKIRHDLMGRVLYIEIAKQCKLITDTPPYYKYHPQPVMENGQVMLYWDRTVLMDATVSGTPTPNRPDMVIINKMDKTAIIIDFANPLDSNLISTFNTKIEKYRPLSQYLKRSHNLKKVVTLPIIISSTGTIPKTTTDGIKYLGLQPNVLTRMQKAVLIKTSSIVREVLE